MLLADRETGARPGTRHAPFRRQRRVPVRNEGATTQGEEVPVVAMTRRPPTSNNDMLRELESYRCEPDDRCEQYGSAQDERGLKRLPSQIHLLGRPGE